MLLNIWSRRRKTHCKIYGIKINYSRAICKYMEMSMVHSLLCITLADSLNAPRAGY